MHAPACDAVGLKPQPAALAGIQMPNKHHEAVYIPTVIHVKYLARLGIAFRSSFRK